MIPDYRHEFVLANARRVWANFEASNNFCIAGASKTPEREQIAYFVPFTIAPNYALVVREDDQRRVSAKDGAASLMQVVGEKSGLIGYVDAGRSYGPELDSILGTAGSNLHRVPVSAPDNLLQSLDAGRMDYTLEFPFVLEYRRKQSRLQHALVSLPLEDVPPLITSYIACTRNAWGKQVSADLAKAVQRAAHESAFVSTRVTRMDAGIPSTKTR